MIELIILIPIICKIKAENKGEEMFCNFVKI